jgi:pyridoxal phosphate enzyme (YggS family)
MFRAANSIPANLDRLHDRIADICAACQRRPADIALMAVSKMHPAEAIVEAYQAGQRFFGENRVQEWQAKSQALAVLAQEGDLRMHLIGPLQNNKTVRAAELFHAIDTLDSVKTGQRLNDAAQALKKVLPVLIEVKLSHEDSKHGLEPEDLPALLAALAPLSHLKLTGLMTVPPWSEDAETARPYFQRLRRLRDENIAAYPTLTELSMGMSNDFAVAIEEGSTTIRLGTAIFGKRV